MLLILFLWPVLPDYSVLILCLLLGDVNSFRSRAVLDAVMCAFVVQASSVPTVDWFRASYRSQNPGMLKSLI